MKIRINIALLFGIILTILSSCVEDNSNIHFVELNEVEITNVEKYYSVKLFDTLHVPAQYNTTIKDSENEFTYLWYLTSPTNISKSDTLSHDPQLSVLITSKHATPGEKYNLKLRVTNKNTGVFQSHTAVMEVTTDFTKGTLILCEEDGLPQVNFLSKVTETEKMMEKVYQRSNGGELVGRNAKKIYMAKPHNTFLPLKEIIVMCDDERGGVILNPVSMNLQRTLGEAIDFTIEGATYNPQEYMKTSADMIDYIIVDKKLCKRATNMRKMNWESPMVSVSGVTNYETKAPIHKIVNLNVIYDTKNGRLLEHSSWNKGGIYHLGSNDNNTTYFDCNNIATDKEYICMGDQETEHHYWILLQDKLDKSYWIYPFQMEVTPINPYVSTKRFISQQPIQLTAAMAPNIKDAIGFSQHSVYKNLLFYATPQGFYSLNIASVRANSGAVMEAEITNAAANNMEITGFEFAAVQVPDPTPEKPAQTKVMEQLRLFVLDNNKSERKGGFCLYELSSTGGLQASIYKTLTGFCDRVIDMDEKYD
ncbi:MAG: PKD-like family lipoprotein [Marinifilaceae bacterium]